MEYRAAVLTATGAPLVIERVTMTGHPPLEAGWIDQPHRRFELGGVRLESGAQMRDAFLSYVVHGDPARLRAATILVLK